MDFAHCKGETVGRRRKTDGDPSPEDRRKAEILAKLRDMIPEMKPPSANRVMLAPEKEWSFKTWSFLLGVPVDDRPWEQLAWLAATDVCGCGVPAEEVLDLFVNAVRAWDDPEKLDKVLRVVANAYSKPRRPHRDFRGDETGQRRGASLVRDQARRCRRVRAGGSEPGTVAVPGPGKAPPSMASEPDDYSL
jgi:hypothetical protein